MGLLEMIKRAGYAVLLALYVGVFLRVSFVAGDIYLDCSVADWSFGWERFCIGGGSR
jgi:hypothetical protein